MNQNSPQRRRIFLTSGLLVVLAVVALVVASALTHHSRDGLSGPKLFPAAHAQFKPGAGGPMGHGRFGMARGGFGSGGTITAINGSTLTLRTMEGTETVNTSGSTQYTKERQTIAFGDLKVGDMVRVIPDAGEVTKPATPGTGTVSASRIVVIEPMLGGRVVSIDGNTVNLVGRGGRELTLTLTDATKYYNGQASADRSAVTVGSHIVASGSQDSLTHLTADTVTVLPAGARGAGGAGPMWRGGFGGFGIGPGRPGAGGGFARSGGFGA